MIRTLSDRVAVDPLPGAGKVGGLYIPDSTKSSRNQTFCRGRVVAAGPKVKSAGVGKLVVMTEYYGDVVEVEGRNLRVGRERDIVAVIDGKALIPLGNRVLMVRCEPAEKAGALFLPLNQKGQQFDCMVAAAGPECRVQRGDRVLVPKAHSVVVRFEGEELLWIDEPALLLIYG